MSREVCGICWTPYDDSYKCACPTPALDVMKCPRCGKRLGGPEHVHTCSPKGLPHCENSCEANAFKIEIRRLKAEKKELLEALKEAADAIESWGAYANDYFAAKHDLQSDINSARAAIAKAEAA